jgi:glycosyltransferase involved in cell wall biosynthesis
MTLLQTVADTAVMGAEWMSLERPTLRGTSRERTGRHLAILARALPPASGVGVYRPLSFMRYGSAHGWRIDAFCSEPPPRESEHGDELLSRVPRETTLHVVPSPLREPSYRFFPRVDGGFTNALAYARYTINSLATDPPDAVLASGPPFFTFVAAFFVARRFAVPLILDYRDEWSECPFDFVTKEGGDLTWERRCLAEADAVLFVTKSVMEHQLRVFPELDRERAHVIPNGWDPDDFASTERDTSSRDASSAPQVESDVFRIAHVGNLAGHTPPFEFLESLRQLLSDRPEWISRLRVTFVGRRSVSPDAALREFAFPEVLEAVDHVGKREAVRRMHESDVLLLLSAPKLDRSLPTKLFEYLASRRPVLIFGSPGEASALIDRLGAGELCPPGSAEALGDALTRLHHRDLSPYDENVRAWLQEHRRDVLAARAFDILESVTSRA